jgi:hypothetical protein
MTYTGEDIAYEFFSNLVGIMGFFGLFLLVITPFYFIRCIKRRDDIGKPFVCLIFGLAFFLSWLFEGYV